MGWTFQTLKQKLNHCRQLYWVDDENSELSTKKLKQDEHDDDLTMEIPDCQPKTPNIIENGVDLAMKIPDSPEGCRKEQKLW